MPSPSARGRHTCLPCVARLCLPILEFPARVLTFVFNKRGLHQCWSNDDGESAHWQKPTASHLHHRGTGIVPPHMQGAGSHLTEVARDEDNDLSETCSCTVRTFKRALCLHFVLRRAVCTVSVSAWQFDKKPPKRATWKWN